MLRALLLLCIFLLSCGGGSGGHSEPTPVPSDPYCAVLLPSPPFSFAQFAAMHPRARESYASVTDAMLRSCLQQIGTSLIIDGSFGYDEPFGMSLVDEWTQGGRSLLLRVYFSSGPTRRRYRSTTQQGFYSDMEPRKYSRAICHDGGVREDYRALVRSRLPLLDYALARGATLQVVPELEDNHTDESFGCQLALTREVLGARPVRYGRSPCGRCYEGNETGVPSGVFVEEHTAKPYGLPFDGVVSNDGSCFKFSAQAPRDDERSLDDLRAARDAAWERGSVFEVWWSYSQGLGCEDNYITGFADPDERTYARLSEAEKLEVIAFGQGR